MASGEVTRGLRVLQVVEACGAGVGRHVRNLCAGLTDLGHQVTLVYSPHRLDEGFRQFLKEDGRAVRTVPLDLRREVSFPSDLRSTKSLLNLMKREGPFDVVHGHSSKGGAIARVAGRLAGTPTIYTPHGLIMASPDLSRTECALYSAVERALGHLATSKMIAVSKGEQSFISGLGLVPTGRLTVIENGIEDSSFAGPPDSDPPPVTEESPLVFGSTMRFSSQKAPGNLVEAFARLLEMLPGTPVRLQIAGGGDLLSETEHQVAAASLEEQVSLLGWRTDILEVLRSLDVYVLSSLYEGGPYTLAEAMAGSLPVVSTAVFGADETVGRVQGNLLVPPGDPDALADGMRKLATLGAPDSLRGSLRETGRANYEYATRHLRQSETTRRILEVYREQVPNKR